MERTCSVCGDGPFETRDDWYGHSCEEFLDKKHLTTETDAGAELACSDGLEAHIDDEEMLARAMKKAVEVGIFPKHEVDTETYLKHWAGMKAVLQAAVGN